MDLMRCIYIQYIKSVICIIIYNFRFLFACYYTIYDYVY